MIRLPTAQPSAPRRYTLVGADEATAVAAGYRPCAMCLPDAYRSWIAAGRPFCLCWG